MIGENTHKTGRKKRNKLSKKEIKILDRYYKICSKETRQANIVDSVAQPETNFRHRVPCYIVDETVHQYICSDLSVTAIANNNFINVSMLYDNIKLILKIANDFFREA